MKRTSLGILAILITTAALHAAEPIIIADFESDTYGAWKVEGDAFGKGPARGKIGGQMPVTGFLGKGSVNSFNGGDGATGKLTSPAFKIERKFITFLIGGGGWEKETCMNLLVDGKVVRTATGPNTKPGGSEELAPASWDVADIMGREAMIAIVDQRKGSWGHINVDHIVQTDVNTAPVPVLVALEKTLTVDGSHLLVPVGNKAGKPLLIGIYDGEKLVQNFNVALPQGKDSSWLAAYPLDHFGLKGKQIRIATVDGKKAPEACQAAFERIKVGAASEALSSHDYAKPYRNQFHASTRRGWNNDPNGMVFHDGKYHLYYQHNPFGIQWGNMHWGHLVSTDLVHWEEKPIALYQKTVADAAFSGGGFVDHNNTAGLGKDTQFIAFTSTGRGGECLAYSKDGGLTFTELPENPVVKHHGRDPKVIWYQPEQKWVMVVFDGDACAETEAIPSAGDPEKRNNNHLAFYESKNLRQWTQTGAFTDADRGAVFECPEMFELPVAGKPGETRWILTAAQNRYFIGKFDGKTFHKEAGPFGTKHGAFYAAQTFSDVPDGRRIEIGWALTDAYANKYPDQLVNMAFTLPHEMTLRETKDGPRVFFSPVKELEALRGDVLAEGNDLTPAKANELLQKCAGELCEVLIEFAAGGPKQIVINGMDASFDGRSARIFTDLTLNEVYADDGISYELRKPKAKDFPSTETQLTAADGTIIKSLKVFRLKSIWPEPVEEVIIFEAGKEAPLHQSLEFHHGSWKFGDGAMIGEQVPTEKHLATIKGLIPFEHLKIEWKMKFVQPKQNFLFVTWPADSGAHAMDFTYTPDDGLFAIVRPKWNDKPSAVLIKGKVEHPESEWHSIVCLHEGPSFTVTIDGTTLTASDEAFARPMGPFYLNGGGFDGAQFLVKDLKVTALK
jgi:fructan beta-fructosidase